MKLISKIKDAIKSIIGYDEKIRIQWIKKSAHGFLFNHYPKRVYKPDQIKIFDLIEENVRLTGEKGNLPLWNGYDQLKNYRPKEDKQRNVYQVRSAVTICRFYTELVTKLKPETIIEIGGAFGVSGMYWLAGIRMNNSGFLYSFEPNEIWLSIASKNMASIDHRFQLINATFEEQYKSVLSKENHFQVAFIDAIHTSDFVLNQYDILKEHAEKGAIILFDDISFSNDMKLCWQTIASKKEVVSSFQINNRVGVVELV